MSQYPPDWDRWKSIPVASTSELCCLSLNVEYYITDILFSEEDAKNSSILTEGFANEDAYSEAFARRMVIIVRNLDYKLDVLGNNEFGQEMVSMRQFVEWADSIKLELPKKFPRGVDESQHESKVVFTTIVEPKRKTEQWLLAKAVIDSFRSDTGNSGSEAEIKVWLKQERELHGYGHIKLDGDRIKSASLSITLKTVANVLKRK